MRDQAFTEGFNIDQLENTCIAGRVIAKQLQSNDPFEFMFRSTPLTLSKQKSGRVEYKMTLKKAEFNEDKFLKENYRAYKTEAELREMVESMYFESTRYSFQDSDATLILRSKGNSKPELLKGKPVYRAILNDKSLKLPYDRNNYEVPLFAETVSYGRFGSKVLHGPNDFMYTLYPSDRTIKSEQNNEGAMIRITSIEIDEVSQEACDPSELAMATMDIDRTKKYECFRDLCTCGMSACSTSKLRCHHDIRFVALETVDKTVFLSIL